MKLYLMRHGEAEGIYDGEEPRLTTRGETEVNRIAKELSSMGIRLDHIYHSGKLRARQTAEIIGEKLGADIPISEKKGLKPNDPVSVIAETLKDSNENYLIVGHLPFVAKLTSTLLAKTESDLMIAFSTASVACLEFENTFGWNLQWFINPETSDPQ